MKKDKGSFVFDYLKSIGVSILNIGDAISDENLEKSYQLITQKPNISKEEFLLEMGLFDEDAFEQKKSIVLKEREYLKSVGLSHLEAQIAASDCDWEAFLKILKEKPVMTRNEFLSRIGIENIDAFEAECKDCIFSFKGDDA